MPRKRDLDPTVWDDEPFGLLPLGARLLHFACISQADDAGRLAGGLRVLRRAGFGFDDSVTIEQVAVWRAALLGSGRWCLYEAGGQEYLHMPAWHDEQKMNRSFPSRLPACALDHSAPTPHTESEATGVRSDEQVSALAVRSACVVGACASQQPSDCSAGCVQTAAAAATVTAAVTDSVTAAAAEPGTRERARARPAAAVEQTSGEPDADAGDSPAARVRRLRRRLDGLGFQAPDGYYGSVEALYAGAFDVDYQAGLCLDYSARKHPGKPITAQFLDDWFQREVRRNGGAATHGSANGARGGVPGDHAGSTGPRWGAAAPVGGRDYDALVRRSGAARQPTDAPGGG